MTLVLTAAGYSLIVAGALLFLIGLIQGVAIPAHHNPRMGLAAHLTAVQCGMALMIFGVLWQFVQLSEFWLVVARWSLMASVYIIWLGITIAAITGASKALPIAGAGFDSGRAQEMLVTALEGGGVVLSLLSGVLIVVGLMSFTVLP